MAARKFDIVVFGATGYVGRFLCRRLQLLSSVKWAAAGRNEERMVSTLQSLGIEDGTTIEADCHDLESMKSLAAQAKVVINATGPAITMGENVVRACIDSGTDYCDITGEVEWVDGMRRRFHNEAEKAGVHIVSCTGLDSIPADMLTYMGNKTLEKNGHGRIGKAEMVLKMKDIGAPHGTIETVISMRERLSKGFNRFIPLAGAGTKETGIPLITKEGKESLKKSSAAKWPVTWVESRKQYGYMHIMKPVDERIVFASASELGYDKDLIFSEVSVPPKSMNWLSGSVFSTAFMGGLGASLFLAKYEWFKTYLRKLVKGASEEGHVFVTLNAKNVGGDAMVRAVFNTPKLGAGMGLTSLTCLESALCLANKDTTPLPGAPGFRTPAVAFGDVLLDRLRAHPECEINVDCGKVERFVDGA